MCSLTNPSPDPAKHRSSTLALGDSQNIITTFLQLDPKNQTLINCAGSKPTGQPKYGAEICYFTLLWFCTMAVFGNHWVGPGQRFKLKFAPFKRSYIQNLSCAMMLSIFMGLVHRNFAPTLTGFPTSGRWD